MDASPRKAQDVTAGRFHELLGGDVPLLAASFADDADEELVARMVRAGLDVAELRLDWFSSHAPDHVADQLARFAGVATLGTVRSAAEGGAWAGPDEGRLDVFRAAMPGLDAVDVELSSGDLRDEVVGLAHGQGRAVVVSHHDFDRTPEPAQLHEIVRRGQDAGSDCVKIAVMPRSNDDVRTLSRFTLDVAPDPVIVIAMGAVGSISRVAFPMLGSRLTFASLGDRVVSGQLPFADTVAMLRTFYPGFDARKAAAETVERGVDGGPVASAE